MPSIDGQVSAYPNSCDYKAALDFLKAQFASKNRNVENKQLYIKETCATDTDNVKVVFKVRSEGGERDERLTLRDKRKEFKWKKRK